VIVAISCQRKRGGRKRFLAFRRGEGGKGGKGNGSVGHIPFGTYIKWGKGEGGGKGTSVQTNRGFSLFILNLQERRRGRRKKGRGVILSKFGEEREAKERLRMLLSRSQRKRKEEEANGSVQEREGGKRGCFCKNPSRRWGEGGKKSAALLKKREKERARKGHPHDISTSIREKEGGKKGGRGRKKHATLTSKKGKFLLTTPI